MLNFRQIFSGFFQFFRDETHGQRVLGGAASGAVFRNFAGFCTRPVCPLLASSSARPTAALRDFGIRKSRAGENPWDLLREKEKKPRVDRVFDSSLSLPAFSFSAVRTQLEFANRHNYPTSALNPPPSFEMRSLYKTLAPECKRQC